jgi:hypothetical protein
MLLLNGCSLLLLFRYDSVQKLLDTPSYTRIKIKSRDFDEKAYFGFLISVHVLGELHLLHLQLGKRVEHDILNSI